MHFTVEFIIVKDPKIHTANGIIQLCQEFKLIWDIGVIDLDTRPSV